MAERGSSKFAGIFADRLEEAPSPVIESAVRKRVVCAEKPEAVMPPQSGPELPPRPIRRAGKRSDPAYKQFSVLLRKDTHRQAVRVLYDADNGQDVSDLVQMLLEQWVKKQVS